MLIFEETSKRNYTLYNTVGGQSEKIIDIELIYAPGSNKYGNMVAFVQDCSTLFGDEFDAWYVGMVKRYNESQYDSNIIKAELPKLMEYCDKYLEHENVNFDGYINKNKVSKNSIFFNSSEIKEIVKASNYLKIYYTIHNDVNMRLSKPANSEIFNQLVKTLTKSSIVDKLHKVVSSKTFEYGMSDKHMWEYLRRTCCKRPEMHISHIFNFILNNILVTCEVKSNPIPYLISVVDESIKWFLRSIYKETIVYSEAISTQDVTSVSGKDNLDSCAHNDTIGKLIVMSHNSLDVIFKSGDGDESQVENYKVIISSLNEPSLFATHFTYPLLSRVLEIPFRHFLTLSESHSYYLNALMYEILPVEFNDAYPTLTKMLMMYNTQKSVTKTTYKLKNIDAFTSTFKNFCGFKNYSAAYEIYSLIVGKIVRNEYNSFFTGNSVPNLPVSSLENELVTFYNLFFSNQIDDLMDSIKSEIDKRSLR